MQKCDLCKNPEGSTNLEPNGTGAVICGKCIRLRHDAEKWRHLTEAPRVMIPSSEISPLPVPTYRTALAEKILLTTIPMFAELFEHGRDGDETRKYVSRELPQFVWGLADAFLAASTAPYENPIGDPQHPTDPQTGQFVARVEAPAG